ncbi:MAG: lysophospholipid acyltransferase family protein [Zoogloeaceae bacterium]|jgi:KDO2-lipid IV(A) lauroyltransferase|nr:lysophospholipid acyltransferase family protein [Zoogloeaceae bacterium]
MLYLFRLLGLLPLLWLHRLGAGAGLFAYFASPRYRNQLKANLAQAKLPSALRIPAARETGKQALEIFHIWRKTRTEAAALVTSIQGQADLDAARQNAKTSGRGVLYLTPHLGCFEITAQYLSGLDHLTALYRPPRQKALQTLILSGRQRDTLHLASADLSGVRALIKALRRGEAVGLLPDQTPRAGEGLWLDFFDRPAYTMTLAARLSEIAGATLFVWGKRLPDGQGYHLCCSAPRAPLTGDIRARAAQINREIEALIRQCPAQYLWGYHRYKTHRGIPPAPAICQENQEKN